MEVKTKIQHEQIREGLKCCPTMEESKDHELRAQRRLWYDKKASGYICLFRGHIKSKKQARKEYMGEEKQKAKKTNLDEKWI